MRISDWSSDVCSSDLIEIVGTDGTTVVTIDLSTATGGSIGIPAKGFLTLYEDGTWATSTPNGDVQQTGKIGRASCRERGCQYVENSRGAGSLKKKNKITHLENKYSDKTPLRQR